MYVFGNADVNANVIVFLQMKDDFCILLALPSTDSKLLDPHQTQCLQTGFIDYLKGKGAAGIINVPKPGGHEVSQSFLIFVVYK